MFSIEIFSHVSNPPRSSNVENEIMYSLKWYYLNSTECYSLLTCISKTKADIAINIYITYNYQLCAQRNIFLQSFNY